MFDDKYVNIVNQFIEHASNNPDIECCGVVVNNELIICKNISKYPDREAIPCPIDLNNAEDQGEIELFIHSHPNATATPSVEDIASCNKMMVPWVVVNIPFTEVRTIYPQEVPLIGREFVHGIYDCYTLVQDYYKQTMEIDLPEFKREDGWWDRGENLYLENVYKEGFVDVTDIQIGDLILMQIRSPVPNHGAIYIGEGLILHHLYGKLSKTDVYGGYWQKVTTKILRYKG